MHTDDGVTKPRRSQPAAGVTMPITMLNRPAAGVTMLVVGALVVLLASPAKADFIDHFADTTDIGQPKVPHVGETRILVLTLEVDGFDPLDMDEVRAYFDEVDNGESQFTTYYERVSLGAFRPVATVFDPITYRNCPLPEDYFGYDECEIPRGGGRNTADQLASLNAGLSVLREVLRRADDEMDVDYSAFDLSGPMGEPDGIADGVLLIHNINFGGIALPTFAVNGNLIFDETEVAIVGVSSSNHVALHEFGHLLGWADLYDESGQTRGYFYSHMGSWGYRTPPPVLDGFSRAVAGWIEPMVIDEGEEVVDLRLTPVSTGGDVVRVRTGDEFWVLENRGAVDGDWLDGDVSGRGLAISHVNMARYPPATPGQWAFRLIDCLNCEPWAPMLMNEQADGEFHLQRDLQRNDEEDLFHPGDEFLPSLNHGPLAENNQHLSSNYYDGRSSGVSVTNIRIEGDDILVDVKVEEPCAALGCEDMGGTCEDGVCTLPEPQPEPEPEPEPDVGTEMDAGMPSSSSGGGDDGCQTAPTAATPAWPLSLLPITFIALFRMVRR